MLILNYDDIQNSLLWFWSNFLERMDKKDLCRMGPGGSGVEKRDPFTSFVDEGTAVFPLIERYLTHDNPMDLDNRCTLFFNTLDNIQDLRVLDALEHDPNVFSFERSKMAAQQIDLQNAIVERQKALSSLKSTGEIHMDGFFIQLDLKKLQKKLLSYTEKSPQYALVDPVTYLHRVLECTLAYSQQQCLAVYSQDTIDPNLNTQDDIEVICDTHIPQISRKTYRIYKESRRGP